MNIYLTMTWEELRSEYRRQARLEGAARRQLERNGPYLMGFRERELWSEQTAARHARHLIERELRRREQADNAVALETLASVARGAL